jgi:hypothetical protein
MSIAEKYISQVNLSFKNAEEGISKISEDIINMEGMTGTKTRHFYNNLLNMEGVRYLEIGTWKGSSVCSGMYGNNATIVCIDNWNEFGGPKEEFLENLNKYKGENNISFIESDCFELDVSVLSKFNIYLYDGGHSEIAHYIALTYYYDCLDDIFIFIVDDWNWGHVRDATFAAITDLKLECLYKKEIILDYGTDDSKTREDIGKKTWHNGLCVFVLKK